MDTFDEHERSGAIGTWTAFTGVATVIGPLGGGALVQAASWRWIFAINLMPVRDHAVAAEPVAQRQAHARSRRHPRRDPLRARSRRPGVRADRATAPRVGRPARDDPADRRDPPAGGVHRLGAALPAADDAAAAVQDPQFRGRQPHDADALRRARRRDVLPRAVHPAGRRLHAAAGRTDAAADHDHDLPAVKALRRAGDRLGPRLFMAGGPALAGLGLLLLVRTERERRLPHADPAGDRRLRAGDGGDGCPADGHGPELGASRGTPRRSRAASTTPSRVSRACSSIAALGRLCPARSPLASTTISRPRLLSPPARAAVAPRADRPLVTTVSANRPAGRTRAGPRSARRRIRARVPDRDRDRRRAGDPRRRRSRWSGSRTRGAVRSAECPGGALAAANKVATGRPTTDRSTATV